MVSVRKSGFNDSLKLNVEHSIDPGRPSRSHESLCLRSCFVFFFSGRFPRKPGRWQQSKVFYHLKQKGEKIDNITRRVQRRAVSSSRRIWVSVIGVEKEFSGRCFGARRAYELVLINVLWLLLAACNWLCDDIWTVEDGTRTLTDELRRGSMSFDILGWTLGENLCCRNVFSFNRTKRRSAITKIIWIFHEIIVIERRKQNSFDWWTFAE